ncbi:MerR family transcriptional regulator [Cytobacillus praedii]|uniref:MerR family transcriptional regulator n=2 Tax=Cytobacillus praedii TaxID=1742358 RepID=UPI003F7FA172
MSKLMTIQDFSDRTGISKSALRYYESKNLLHPAGRNSSGYRVYSENQVPIIKLVSSLRLADVPIKDIQAYLKENDENSRRNMMDDWIELIKKRLDILNVSLRYLESDSMNDQIYLIEKADENIIWFSAESETGRFREHFIKRGKELEKLNIPIKSCYLKYLSGKDLIKANIGFGVPFGIQTSELSDVELVEHLASCVYIALSFHAPISEIQNGYWKLINYANEHKWIPAGPILEWYRGDDFSDLDLLMPVTKLEKERIV